MAVDNAGKIVDFKDLEADIQEMCRLSVEARKASYSPYSQFAVGAALRCVNGSLYSGCNVENASFTVGICAERTAIVKAVSEHFRKFTAIAVSAALRNEFVAPCGACRQFIAEFACEKDIEIYLVKPDLTDVCVTSIRKGEKHLITEFGKQARWIHIEAVNALKQRCMEVSKSVNRPVSDEIETVTIIAQYSQQMHHRPIRSEDSIPKSDFRLVVERSSFRSKNTHEREYLYPRPCRYLADR